MKNWKTSFAGLFAGFLQLYAGGLTLKNAAVATALVTIGAAAKDYDVTGGSRQNNP
jgi:hypothetical protein